MKQQRLEWVDVAKGMGMFFVIVGHCNGENFLQILLYAFHMPLFFFLSGLFILGRKESPLIDQIKRKSKQLLIPLYVFSIVLGLYSYTIAYLSGNDFSISNRLIGMLLQFKGGEFHGSLWFLSCLFIMSTAMLLICRLTAFDKFGGVICAMISLIGSVYVKYVGVDLPWCIELAAVNMIFMWLGVYISRNPNIVRFSPGIFFLSVIVFVAFAYMNYYHLETITDEFKNQLGIIPLFYIAAISGIYVIVLLSQKCGGKLLNWMGKNSLLLYCLHFLLLLVIYKACDILLGNSDIPVSMLAITKALLIVLILSPIIRFFNVKCSWVLGKF